MFRDLATLREAGVPMQFDPKRQTHRIPGASLLPPTSFTSDEALALVALAEELGQSTRLPFYEPARRAALKLESSLPVKLRDYLRDVRPAVSIQLAPVNPLADSQPYFEQILESIAGRQAIRIRYDSLTEWKVITTKLSPYQLLFSRRSWYVIGRSSLHRAVRTFNVGRIKTLIGLSDRYNIPRGFSLEKYLRNAWHLIPEKGVDQKVCIRFQPMVAQNVAEVNWHRTQRIEWHKSGAIDYHVTVSGLGEITWWVLGYGDQAEVLAPIELRRRVARHARKLAERYKDVQEEKA